MLVIKNSYLASIIFNSAPSNGQKLYFKDIPTLRDKTIVGVEAYSASDLAVTPDGNTSIADADADQITITLVDKNQNEFIFNMPVLNFNPRSQGGFIREISPAKVDFTRSYITVTDSTGIGANEAIAFTFYYHAR